MCRRHFEEMAGLPYSDPVRCYLACQLELELAVSSLLELWEIKSQQRGRIWLVSLGCWLLLLILYWANRFYTLPGELLLTICVWLMGIFALLLPALAVLFGALKFKKEHRNIVVKHEQY